MEDLRIATPPKAQPRHELIRRTGRRKPTRGGIVFRKIAVQRKLSPWTRNTNDFEPHSGARACGHLPDWQRCCAYVSAPGHMSQHLDWQRCCAYVFFEKWSGRQGFFGFGVGDDDDWQAVRRVHEEEEAGESGDDGSDNETKLLDISAASPRSVRSGKSARSGKSGKSARSGKSDRSNRSGKSAGSRGSRIADALLGADRPGSAPESELNLSGTIAWSEDKAPRAHSEYGGG